MTKQPRLNAQTISGLPAKVERVPVTGTATAAGEKGPRIVHIGLGQFAKAHLAYYLQRLMVVKTDDALPWCMTAVNLYSDRTQQQLAPQDNLFTLTAHSFEGSSTTLIECIDSVLFAGHDQLALQTVLLDAQTRIVSLTITEKGYHLDALGKLGFGDPGIQHDLAHLDQPETALGWLAWAIRERRRLDLAPFTVMSLDNLNQNGRVLQSALVSFCAQFDAVLSDYIRDEMCFPCSMVDRIVPSVTEAIVETVEASLGLRDEACVVTEAFSQWALEDKFSVGRPAFESVGVQMCDDVEPFESMKLRLLNGAHSAIAYLGCLSGFETVADCMANDDLRRLIERLMKQDILPQVTAPPGVELTDYIDSLLRRFGNEHLNHRCEQIAMDGSQKIPQRWLPVLRDHGGSMHSSAPLISFSLAAWIKFTQIKDELQDPMAKELKHAHILAADSGGQAVDVVSSILATDMFDGAFRSPEFVVGIVRHFEQIEQVGITQAIRDIVAR